jgi:hypothetical protein
MEPFTEALEVSCPGNAAGRGHTSGLTGSGAPLSIIWAAPKNICASGVTAISCRTNVTCSDAFVDGLNLARVRVIRERKNAGGD